MRDIALSLGCFSQTSHVARTPSSMTTDQSFTHCIEAVRAVSGCAVIVDSTKDPSYAFVLRGVHGIDLRVVQLVRDSRGVAYSWSKGRVERPEYANHPSLRQTFMERRTPWKSAVLWSAKNLLFDVLGRSNIPITVEQYESLVVDPTASLRRVLALVTNDLPEGGQFEEAFADSEFEALPLHSLGGNRVRFERGTVRLRADEEWRGKMGRRDRLVVGLLTLPLLLRYGYAGHIGAL